MKNRNCKHAVDNQGLCHNCGKPLNADYGIEYFGNEAWHAIVRRWENRNPQTLRETLRDIGGLKIV